jgi:catechol 2,3-dioxygenase-like lactoylglutathione lyase family enzyme
MPEDTKPKPTPALKLKFLSHGTLITKSIDKARVFYEEFFGFECVRPSTISLWIRLGGSHIYVVVENKEDRPQMDFLNHNGIDVLTDAEVDDNHKICVEQAEKWNLHKISKPRIQHGTYSFYFWDADDNCWEILSNPGGGYTWMFDRGDQEGMGHMVPDFERPGASTEGES